MAPLLMFDSTDVTAIPLSAKMVLGYLAGARIPSTLPALRLRFPHLTPVVCCVTAQQNGDVLDVENGDARPEDAPGWAKRQRSLGNPDPIVYCSASVWPAVKANFAIHNEPLPWYFEAHYDNVAVLSADPRAVAKQYANAKITGSNLDISLIGPNWPGLKQEDDLPTTTDILNALDAAAVSTLAGTPVPGTKFIDAVAKRSAQMIAAQQAAS